MDKKVNITLELDAELLRQICVLAVAEKKSVSSLLATHLQQIVRERTGYDRARKRALARLEDGLDLRWTPSDTRDEVHER